MKWGWAVIAVLVVGGVVVASQPEDTPSPVATTTTLDAAGEAFLTAVQMNQVPEGGGVYEIGVDINAGRWRTAGASDPEIPLCYYATTPTPDGSSDIDQQGVTEGPAIIDLPAGQFFHTSGCQAWTRE